MMFAFFSNLNIFSQINQKYLLKAFRKGVFKTNGPQFFRGPAIFSTERFTDLGKLNFPMLDQF
jgi:hypothetical protein